MHVPTKLPLFLGLLLSACAAPRVPLAPVAASVMAVRPAAASSTRAPVVVADTPVSAEAVDLSGRQDVKHSRTLASYGGQGGIFSLTLGLQEKESASDWKPVDSRAAGTFEFAWFFNDSDLALNAGLGWSYARDTGNTGLSTLDAYSFEFLIGPKYFLSIRNSPLILYAGTGVSLIYENVEGGFQSAPGAQRRSDDFGVGIYGQLGAMIRLNDTQGLGLEYRGLFGSEADLFGQTLDSGYNQIALVFATTF